MGNGRAVAARLMVPLCLGVFLVALASFGGAASGAPSATTPGSSVPTPSGGVKGQSGYLVYWDQNEEVDFLAMPKGTLGQLLPAWDLNGQVCVLPGGRFVGGYDPTLPSQHNLGGLKPYKQPPDGEELDEPNGSFSGETLYVPGPYKMKGQSIGSDSPPTSNGVFNNNQTYTGCAIDSHDNVFANDIATAQGNYPPPSSGRLVEWFAPNYTTYCVVYGPTSGGYGPHHTDGSGGLAQPGMMALAPNGDLLVPNVGTSSVLRFAHASLPTSANQCPGGVYPRSKVQVSTFYKVSFPAGVAEDPTCGCYAVSSYIGDPSHRLGDRDRATRAGTRLGARDHDRRSGQEPRSVQPVRDGLRPGWDAVLHRHPRHVYLRAQRVRPGQLRGPGHAGHLHQRSTLDPGHGGGWLRLPDQRDRVRPGEDTLSVPEREDQGSAVGTLREPGARRKAPRRSKPATAGFG